MSRTIRRKGMNYPRNWYHGNSDEADFNRRKEEYLAGDWRTTYEWYNHYTEQYVVAARKWYYAEVTQNDSYEQFVIRRDAVFHSDAGFPVHNCQVKADFRRSLNRQLRTQQKHQIDVAIIRGEEEDLYLKPFRRDANWWY